MASNQIPHVFWIACIRNVSDTAICTSYFSGNNHHVYCQTHIQERKTEMITDIEQFTKNVKTMTRLISLTLDEVKLESELAITQLNSFLDEPASDELVNSILFLSWFCKKMVYEKSGLWGWSQEEAKRQEREAFNTMTQWRY